MLALISEAGFKRFIEATRTDLGHYGPELVLAATACALLIADLFVERRRSRDLAPIALLGTVATLFFVISRAAGLEEQGLRLFSGMVVVDRFASFFQGIFLAGTAVTIVLAWLSRELEERPMGEFYAMLLGATLGMFLMVEATDYLVIFLAVELLSIPSYVLTGWIKRSRASSEAALKYVIYGSVSSGIMLYGFSLFFGMTGSMKLDGLARLVQSEAANPHAIALAAFFAFAGFGYKMAAVPMQFWAPDVYQGAPTAVTAWLSVTSKAAGIGLFIRFMHALGLGKAIAAEIDWVSLMALLAAVTMTLGNLAALFQNNIKRLLAYSSVAHVGYILMGVAAFGGAGELPGWKAVAFYLVAYLLMNLGAFACVVLIANQTRTEEIEGMRGLGVRAPALALSFAIFLVSLIGIPPTAGFAGKFQLFLVAVNHKALGADGAVYHPLLWLAVVAAINTAISAYYYARVLKTMFLDEGPETKLSVPALGGGLVLFHAIAVVYFGIFFRQLLGWTESMGTLSLGVR
jgi:NADH-quinone oxidoreductase subunit N